MRTKIEYSVDLKEVPVKIKEKLLETSDLLQKAAHYVESISQDLEYENVAVVSNRLERLRRQLFHADNTLNDCETAIKGYVEVLNEMQAEQNSAKVAEVVDE